MALLHGRNKQEHGGKRRVSYGYKSPGWISLKSLNCAALIDKGHLPEPQSILPLPP